MNRRIAYVSTYVPKRCGLATYTFHLRQAVRAEKSWKDTDPVVVITGENGAETYDSPYVPLRRDCQEDYEKAAAKLNQMAIDLVSLQHEFGIFGGEAGAHILTLVRQLKKPLVTTFHTVFEQPAEPYASIQRELAEKSDKIIVMNRKAIELISRSFGISEDKIAFIPHGTPIPDKDRRDAFRQQFGWTERKVLMTFGLLSAGKGIEFVLNILPQIAERVPNLLYAIVGQTHPEVKKREGEKYREQLQEIIQQQGLQKHVTMINRYVEEDELVKYMTACDLYITPYPGMEQITSGTLAYAIGMGRPVVSTPYRYAQDVLTGCEELLLPYGNENAWIEKVVQLLTDDATRNKWELEIEKRGKAMHWPQVGKQHAHLFRQVIEDWEKAASGVKALEFTVS